MPPNRQTGDVLKNLYSLDCGSVKNMSFETMLFCEIKIFRLFLVNYKSHFTILYSSKCCDYI